MDFNVKILILGSTNDCSLQHLGDSRQIVERLMGETLYIWSNTVKARGCVEARDKSCFTVVKLIIPDCQGLLAGV